MTGSSVLDKPAREKRCAIYTRKSTEEGLDSEFNSLDAQRASCAAFIASQRHERWVELSEAYDDGGYSGGSLDRPAFQRLLSDVRDGKIEIIVVYKVDRLTRSLLDFARIVGVLEESGASFVSITQAFNSTTSMGRLTLNVLLSFAQFEREIASERVRDKIAASKAKGIWMGGTVPLGYDVVDRRLVLNQSEATTVRHIFNRYLHGDVAGRSLVRELAQSDIRSKTRWRYGQKRGDALIGLGALYAILKNPLYMGKIAHRSILYDGKHEAIVDEATFHRVSLKLERSRVAVHLRTAATEPSPLAGLLVDSHNRPMSPSHTQRSGRRYRYYVSKDRIGEEGRKTWRVTASELERLVLDCVIREVERAVAASASNTTLAPDHMVAIQVAGRAMIDTLRRGPSLESRAIQRDTIAKIVVGENDITISGSLRALGLTRAESADFRVTARTRALRHGRTLKLVIPPPDSTAPADAPFVRLIAQSFAIRLRLDSGQPVAQIAAEVGLHPAYVVDLARVSYLAPAVVSSLLQGTHPDSLSRKRLMDTAKIPLHWHLQRELFS